MLIFKFIILFGVSYKSRCTCFTAQDHISFLILSEDTALHRPSVSNTQFQTEGPPSKISSSWSVLMGQTSLWA